MTRTAGRFALIVAIAEYEDERLRTLHAPRADADRLAAVLTNPAIGDFEVDVAKDANEGKLKRQIAKFVSDRRPDDLLLIHFSCHGLKDAGGELYLAAKDTEVGLLSATGISSAWLNGEIGRTRSKRVVVMLDCCFGGSFPFGMRARASGDVNVQQLLQGRGRAVITASSAMEYAYEGDKLEGEAQPSVFTEAVVEGLASGKADRDGDKLISVDDLYDYVYDRVKEQNPSQNPNKLSTLEGRVYVAASIYEPPIHPAKLDDQLMILTESPFPSARLAAVQELTKLGDARDRSVSLAAHQALEAMLDDDSVSVKRAANDALHDPERRPRQAEPSAIQPAKRSTQEAPPITSLTREEDGADSDDDEESRERNRSANKQAEQLASGKYQAELATQREASFGHVIPKGAFVEGANAEQPTPKTAARVSRPNPGKVVKRPDPSR